MAGRSAARADLKSGFVTEFRDLDSG